MAGCRAILLSELLSLADGVTAYGDVQPCETEVSHVVVIRREGLEFAADVCAGHAALTESDVGFVRVIKKRRRT